jgi:hypothetical protein
MQLSGTIGWASIGGVLDRGAAGSGAWAGYRGRLLVQNFVRLVARGSWLVVRRFGQLTVEGGSV